MVPRPAQPANAPRREARQFLTAKRKKPDFARRSHSYRQRNGTRGATWGLRCIRKVGARKALRFGLIGLGLVRKNTTKPINRRPGRASIAPMMERGSPRQPFSIRLDSMDGSTK